MKVNEVNAHAVVSRSQAATKEELLERYQDPLRKYPLKLLAYSNEVGAAIHGISPKLGTALWVPALMYFGADIYDKYKNDETLYNPSKKRGLKETVFQALASVFLPTAAVSLGQRVFSTLNRLSENGLSTQSKIDIIEKSLAFMESQSLHTFEDNPWNYVENFKNSVSESVYGEKGRFRSLSLPKKLLSLINPLKDGDTLAHANLKYAGDFAVSQAADIMKMRQQLLRNEQPKAMSKKLFRKFQVLQSEYAKIYPPDKYMGKAAKAILKDFHKKQIFNNKMIKTVGGFVGLALLAKPIDDFVENIVIKKTVEPGLDYIAKSYENSKTAFLENMSNNNSVFGRFLSSQLSPKTPLKDLPSEIGETPEVQEIQEVQETQTVTET